MDHFCHLLAPEVYRVFEVVKVLNGARELLRQLSHVGVLERTVLGEPLRMSEQTKDTSEAHPPTHTLLYTHTYCTLTGVQSVLACRALTKLGTCMLACICWCCAVLRPVYSYLVQ